MSVRPDGWRAVEDVLELCNERLTNSAMIYMLLPPSALTRYRTLCWQSVRKSAACFSAMCVSGVLHCPVRLLCFRVHWEWLFLCVETALWLSTKRTPHIKWPLKAWDQTYVLIHNGQESLISFGINKISQFLTLVVLIRTHIPRHCITIQLI